MQDQGQNVLKAECKVSLPAVLVPREAQGARPSENARALLLHGVLKGASVHRYLTFALLRDASSPVVRRRLIDLCVCVPRDPHAQRDSDYSAKTTSNRIGRGWSGVQAHGRTTVQWRNPLTTTLLLHYRDDVTILNDMIHSDTLRAEPYTSS